MNKIEHPFKTIRATAIIRHLLDAKITRTVCLTCGNAGTQLEEVAMGHNINVIVVGGSSAPVIPNRWLSPYEIPRIFGPDCFDATSGNLPFTLMNTIAEYYQLDAMLFRKVEQLKQNGPIIVPSGSGETAVCLKLAFPEVEFIPQFNNNVPATFYDSNAPLVPLLNVMFKEIERIDYVN